MLVGAIVFSELGVFRIVAANNEHFSQGHLHEHIDAQGLPSKKTFVPSGSINAERVIFSRIDDELAQAILRAQFEKKEQPDG